jgi:hypothetical protein
VARVERPVLGLHDRAAGGVDLGERLAEPDEVLEVGHLGVAARVALADERRAVDPGERHVVAAHVDGVLGIARLELELARRLRDLLEHEFRIEEDLVALDALARLREELDRLGKQEFHAELGDDAAPAPVERVHRLLAEDLVAGHFVDEHGDSP